MLERIRQVTFDKNEKHVREFHDEDMNEHVRDVERVTETLVQFLKRTVKDNTFHLGQHRRGHENDEASYSDVFEHQYQRIAQKVLQIPEKQFLEELDGVYETMMEYLDRPTAKLFQHLFRMQTARNTQSKEYRQLHWCAIIVMLAGLGSFLEYGHCLNKCADALLYYKDRDEIWFSNWGVAVPEFARLCLKSHRAIEDALGWDDIRDLDQILQEASQIVRKGAKVCSLTFPTPDVPKHHVGPLTGTKRKIVSTHKENGQTIHTTRRGATYTMNDDGTLQSTIKI